MPFPIFWLALAYAAGLALYAGVEDSPPTLLLLATGALMMGGVALWLRWPRRERERLWMALACALGGVFLLGGATIKLHQAAVEPTRVDRLIAAGRLDLSQAVRLTGWLRRAPERKPFATFYELELERVETGGRRFPTSGGLRLSYFAPVPDSPSPPMPELHYADRVEVLVRVHPPVKHRNPGSFDWRAHLAGQGIFLEGSLKDPALLKTLSPRRGHTLLAWVEQARTLLLARLDQLLPPETRPDRNAVLRAMLLGDRGFLSHRQKENFRLSGAYHVLVVSGLHVGVIALLAFWLVRRLGGDEWAAFIVTVPLLVFYLLLVEDRPPVERAVWMVSLYLLARVFFRQVHAANPLALAALLVLFVHPGWLFETSFHFSFGAVFMIAFFAVPWVERTSACYRQALMALDAPDRAEFRPAGAEPRLAQFRLDLRALAELLSGLVAPIKNKERVVLRFLAGVVRAGLRAWDFFLLSFAIWLGLILLTAVYFNRVIWVGLLTNVLVVPLVGLIVPLGLAALLLAVIWPAASALLGPALSRLVGVLLYLVDALAGAHLSRGIPAPPTWVVPLYLATLVLLAVAVARRRRRLRNWTGLAQAALILLIVTHPLPPQLHPGELEVTVLDVGQGDALFIAFPNREIWLVDGGRGAVEIRAGYRVGEPVGETVVVPYLRARGIKRLDRVWLTHAHHDHMSGLKEVVDEFAVGSFDIGPAPQSESYRELLDKVGARGIPLIEHRAGERLTVGGVEVEVLWPVAAYQPGPSPSNNDSLVLRLCRAETCVLLPGDIEADVEKKLAQAKVPLTAAALKVPHHGGRHAASREFLAAVAPRAAIISVGATNPFGHPYNAVLARLRAGAEQVYRTDRDGAVAVRVQENGIHVQSYRQQERRHLYPNLWSRLVACGRHLAQP